MEGEDYAYRHYDDLLPRTYDLVALGTVRFEDQMFEVKL